MDVIFQLVGISDQLKILPLGLRWQARFDYGFNADI